jgi:hypothetical protein
VIAELFHRDTDIHYKQYPERLLQTYLKTNQNRCVEILMMSKIMICGNARGESGAVVLAGLGKVEAPVDIEPSLTTCTHLVYGFAVIDGGSYKLVPLDEYQELDSGKGYYRAVTSIKKRYPGLNVLLSVGGLADPAKDKYLTLVCEHCKLHLYNTVA